MVLPIQDQIGTLQNNYSNMSINKINKYFQLVREARRGIEREFLRTDPNGLISQKPHPKSLGSALTHPFIKTDYSESQLELITPPMVGVDDLYEHLLNTHIFVAQRVGDELFWPASMPCQLEHEQRIPLAQYGHSNIGKMKTIYRMGLKIRYGSPMQTISGVHYNFSFSDSFWEELFKQTKEKVSFIEFKNQRYMDLIRNYHEMGWVISYLFGASPLVCASFLKVQNLNYQDFGLRSLDQLDTLLGINATSLRMSGLGYQNKSGQKELEVCYNTLDSYLSCIENAMTTKDPEWSKFGVKDSEGNYIQLSESTLQIENEYYGVIRPKRASSGRPTTVLRQEGIDYVEIRNLDINPFSELGISKDQIRFMDVFLSYCFFEKSEYFDKKDVFRNRENLQQVVMNGRDKNCVLQRMDGEVSLKQWFNEIMDGCLESAEHWGSDYVDTVKKLKDGKILSQRVLEELEDSKESFFQHNLNLARAYTESLKNMNLSKDKESQLKEIKDRSLDEQKDLEESDDKSLDEFIKSYYLDE